MTRATRRKAAGAFATLLLLVLLPLVGVSPSMAAPAATTYTQTATVPVSVSPNTMALNPSTGLLYIAGYWENSVVVVNARTNTVVDTIATDSQPDAIAFDTATGKIYVAAGNADSTGVVDVVSAATNTVIKRIQTIASASNIAVDAATNMIYVVNGGYRPADTVTVISGATDSIVKTIAVASPVGIAIDPTTNTIWVTDSNYLYQSHYWIAVISGSTNTVTATIPLGWVPTSVELNTVTHVFYVCRSQSSGGAAVVAFSGSTRAQIGSVAIPQLSAISIDSQRNLVYALNNSSLIAIDGRTNMSTSVIGPLETTLPVDSIVADPASDSVYAAYPQSNAVEEYSTLTVTSPQPRVVLPANSASSFRVTTAGAAGATFSISSGSLPQGLSLQGSTGTISGTPTEVGTSTYRLTATAANGAVNSQDYRQTVVDSARAAGADRYETAVAVAEAQYPSTAPVVFVASGTNYPDALSAGTAAGVLGGPLLLTDPTRMPADVLAEIKRLQPSRIVVVGGAASVSESVFAQLRAVQPTIVRQSGADRYATSRAVVSNAFTTAATVYVATGVNFPDALSAGGAAGANGAPLLLVNGSASWMDAGTSALLTSLHATRIMIVGGPSSVSDSMLISLGTIAPVTRLAGSDRYGTSAAVNEFGFSSAHQVLLANGLGFPDALAASAWAASSASPLYIAPANCVPRQVLTDIQNDGATRVTLIGGTGSLTTSVAHFIPCP